MARNYDERRNRARTLQIGTAGAASTIGGGLGGAKLRDSFKEQYPEKFARGVGHVTSVARKARLKPVHVAEVARLATEGRPGFKTLAAATTVGGLATGAKHYQHYLDHVERKGVVKARVANPAVGVSPPALDALGTIAAGTQKLTQLAVPAVAPGAVVAGAAKKVGAVTAPAAASPIPVKPATGAIPVKPATAPAVAGAPVSPMAKPINRILKPMLGDTVTKAAERDPFHLSGRQVAAHPVRSGYAAGSAVERRHAVFLENRANRARFHSDTLNNAAKTGIRSTGTTRYKNRPQYHYSKPRVIGL